MTMKRQLTSSAGLSPLKDLEKQKKLQNCPRHRLELYPLVEISAFRPPRSDL